MQQIAESEILQACRVLFGAELHLSREFLDYLQPSGVRTAYRKQAKEIHPDLFNGAESTARARQEKLFQNLNQAHEVLQSFLKQRRKIPGKRTPRPEAPASTAPGPAPATHRFYRGPLPSRPLHLGQFLYYRGLIPYAAVIAAITWQRRQRPPLGEIACRWRWLNSADVKRVLQQRGGFQRFGERAKKLGLLNSLQVRTLLLHQRSQQQKIGHFFIEHSYLSEHLLEGLLKELAAHNLIHCRGGSTQFYTSR